VALLIYAVPLPAATCGFASFFSFFNAASLASFAFA
jgi:hypothetical protein